MADAIRLQHVNIRIDTNLYFYDGEVPVVGGVVTLDNEVWARNAWLRGYRINADTGEQILPGDIVNHFAVVETAAESGTETDADEGAFAGGQPVLEDGVRTSEQPRDAGIPEGGADGGDGDGAPDGAADDGLAGEGLDS